MSGYKVLIVDDDETTHEILNEYLALYNYEVHHARDGAMGLQLVEDLKPDLVLLDIQMPIMDGFQTMETIARCPELKDVQVLFISSLDRPNLKVRGLDLGAEDYIVKPFDRAELMARIKAALRRGAKYRRVESSMEGKLTDISLPELLQTMEIGRKTALVRLMDMEAAMYVEQGSLVKVQFMGFTGTKAIQRVFYLESGRFAIKFDELYAGADREPMPIQRVLMGTLTYLDELGVMMERIGPLAATVSASADAPEAISSALSGRAMALRDLLVALPGELKDNAEGIAAAHTDGTLQVN